MNILREKVLKRENICGTHVSLTDPSIAEMLGYIGFDFLWLDLEHTHIPLENLYHMLNAAKAAGTPTVVRVPQHDFTITKKVMEMGPDGIIFPMIKNAEEAKEMISYTLYPPDGVRGFGPNRAVRYGIDDSFDFFINGNSSTCRFIQIEQKTTVDELETIINENPFIDGYIFGLCDLAGSINSNNDVFSDATISLVKDAIKTLTKYDKTCGISLTSCDDETITKYHDMGINMISCGADFDYIIKCAKAELERFKKLHLCNNLSSFTQF